VAESGTMACGRVLLLLLLTALAKGQDELAAQTQLEEEEDLDFEKSELVGELLEDDLERQGRQEGERDPVASPDLEVEEETQLDTKNEEQPVQNEELKIDLESEERQARQADADADAGGGDDAADKCEECEEAWAYVEFLKESVSKKVEMILEETLFEAKVRTIDLDKTVAEAMKQVMEMRQSLLDRIKKIRKGDEEITICPGQDVRQEEKLSEFRMKVMSILLKLVDTEAANVDGLTDIGNSLLGFKAEVGDEIMRLLTLPQPKGCSPNPPTKTECPECDPIALISKKLEKLIKCASKDDAAQQQATQQQEEEDCAELDPTMYAMELITCNEKVDEEIKNLYQQIVGSVDDSERQKGFDSLNGFKGIRNQIDEVIKSLLDATKADCDDECQKKLNKIVQRNLRGVSSDTKQLLEECTYVNGCIPGADCEGCAVEVLQDTISRLDGYSTFFQDAEENPDDLEAAEEAKESIRADMMSYISQITSDSTNILRQKVTDEDLDECEEQKLEVYGKLKGPLWMLVNETIFTPSLESLSITVVAAANMSDLLLAEYCSESPRPPSNDGPTCLWDEYKETNKYLEMVDEIIQKALFKADKDDAQMTALRGFVDLQKLLDNRVKVLFQNLLACPAEVDVIKKDYMSQLNKCMAEFMNGRLKFEDMSKSQRIGCTKVLRTKMEERMSELLSSELEQSINQIQDRNQS